MDSLSMNVQYIKGVGAKRASLLNKLGVYTVLDLLYYLPRKYEDRSRFIKLKDATIGEKASFKIKIVGPGQIIRPRRNMSILKVPFQDSSGNGYLVWFNQDYLQYRFKRGDKLRVNGKVNRRGMEIQIMNPTFENINQNKNVGRIIPIYDLTKGLSNNIMKTIIYNCLEEYSSRIREVLPKKILNQYRLMDIRESIINIHRPKSLTDFKEARKRLVFEELFLLQLGLLLIKNKNYRENKGISFPKIDRLDEFIDNLPFKLTLAQERVLKEIEKDMGSEKQMNRLVQGDVGSGKTIIAALSMFRAVKSGYQAAMMAPTEILATQHYESLKEEFKGYNISCELLVGSLKNREKEKILKDLKTGEIDILIGTHALIEDDVEFDNLALVITDEQHRFGVRQRNTLNRKGLGINPDILVMTATPIPRTLALILYGDLDISIIDELPPGRKEVETYAVGNEMIDRALNFAYKQIQEGRQAYIVCPLIEDSEEKGLNSAEKIYKKLKSGIFKNNKVGLLHGKMATSEKEKIMSLFKENKLDLLVSTTVIEVGVDVPNANIMIIYNAERFGLAQLHQLRGRVGRGQYQSYCILINSSKGLIARERMRILQNSSDGFVISEKDLELRGPGEFFGTRQHGIPELKIANLFKDIEVLRLAQKEAIELISQDPNLRKDQYKLLREKIDFLFGDLKEA